MSATKTIQTDQEAAAMSWRQRVTTAAVVALFATACSTPTTGPMPPEAAPITSTLPKSSTAAGVDGPTVVAAPPCKPAPVGTTSVHVNPTWETGTARVIQYQFRQDPNEQNTSGLQRTVNLTAEAETADGYTFVQRAGPTDKYVNDEYVTTTNEPPLDSVMNGLEVRYQLTSAPRAIEILNIDDLRLRTAEYYQSGTEDVGQFTRETYEHFVQLAETISDENWVDYFTPELVQYHLLADVDLTIGEQVTRDSRIRNPIYTDYFVATDTLSIEELVDRDGCVLIRIVTNPDQAKMEAQLPESRTEQGFRLVRESLIQYDYHANRVRTVSTEAVIRQGGSVRRSEVWAADITDS